MRHANDNDPSANGSGNRNPAIDAAFSGAVETTPPPGTETGIDIALLDRLQRAAFGYFTEFTNPRNGLVADATSPESPSSIAAVGFALSCYPVAVSRNWMSRDDAIARTLATLRFFDGSEQDKHAHATGYKGFYYHFLHMETGERVWNCELSFIDSAILFAGMLTAASFFDRSSPEEEEIRSVAARLYSRADWRWAQGKDGFVRLGWKPKGSFLRFNWSGYSEALLLLILGLGAPAFPLRDDAYRQWLHSCEWRNFNGGGYLYAGPLFIHLFPQAWLDLQGLKDPMSARHGIDYFENTRRAIAEHRNYAIRNPKGFTGYGGNLWGLTACEGPRQRLMLRNGRRRNIGGYVARGAPFGPDDGTVAPWSGLASLPFAPDVGFRSLRHILSAYPNLLKNSRLPDSFNPSVPGDQPEGWISPRSVGLDQGLIVMMIENYRSGLIWKLMRKSGPIRRGLQAAGFSGGWLDDAGW
jgi:hypothetical protein